MTAYLYVTRFLVPAGTPQTAPLVQPVVLQDLILDTVRVVIPDGHNGTTGIAVLSGGVNIVPYGQGGFLTGNDEPIDFPWGGEITESGLSLAGYNTDIWDHAFLLRWTAHDIGPAGSPVVIVSPQAAPPAQADVNAIAALSGTLTPPLALPADLTAPALPDLTVAGTG